MATAVTGASVFVHCPKECQVSPQARDRAREYRSDGSLQAITARSFTGPRRSGRVLGIGAALVLVLGGLVGCGTSASNDKATATATATATPSTQPSSAPPVAGACAAPPAVPTDQRSGKLPDKKTAAGKTFIAVITTNCGDITVELDGTKAPQTVASFLGLAKSGYWADSPCHRLTTADPLFVLQCGDPTGSGSGSPGYGYGVENAPADFIYPAGTLAMARTSDPNTNGGQFFIVYKQSTLNDPVGYSIFGKITSGMGIVDKIAAAGAAQGATDGAPVQPISILKVDVTEKKA